MNQILISLGHAIIGKNLPSLMRALATFVGGLLLATAIFDPAGVALDPALGDAAIAIDAPSREQIEDGATVGEVLSALGGLLLIWISRLFSWLRARNLDWLAKFLGPLIGRGWVSLSRAALTAIAGGLAYLTATPAAAPEVIADMPLATGLGAVASFILARVLSATQDAKANPVSPRLDPKSLDV